MSRTEQDTSLRTLERRVEELERARDRTLARDRTISERYARLYAPIAVVLVALSGLPPFNDVIDEDVTVAYGTLWDMARRTAGDPAVFGLFLLGVLAVLLVVASFGVAGTGTLAGIIVTSGLIILMLIIKPGTGEPVPELSGVGVVGLVIVICTALMAAIHAFQLVRSRP
jgi:hypothetical protein